MKLLRKDREEGFAEIEVENEDDLWHLQTLVEKGDGVKAKTQRTKLDGREKKTCTLELEVEKEELEGERLRLTGEITEGEEDIELGYHTFNIEPGKKFTLYKDFSDEQWGELLEAAEREPYSVLFCLIEKGEADFYLVRESGIEDVSNLRGNVPGKLYADQDTGDKFIQEVKQYLERASRDVESVVLAGPGFVKQQLANELSGELREKILIQDTSVTGRTGLNEAIKRGALDKIVKDSRISRESSQVQEFLEELERGEKASYGEPVEELAEMGAVEKLLVTPEKYRKKHEVAENVEQQGGTIEKIHTDHEAGERLEEFGGMAAILRYKP